MIKIETSSAKMQNMLIFSSDTFERHHNKKISSIYVFLSLQINRHQLTFLFYIFESDILLKTLPVFIILSNVLFHLNSNHGVQ